MPKKTTYEVDLTVEGPNMSSLAELAAAKQAVQQQAGKDEASPKPADKPSAEPPKPSAPEKPECKEVPEKCKDKKKKKKKSKKQAQSSSSSSSSSSCSSSDDEDSCRGVQRALQPWRYPLYTPSASYRQLDAVAGSHQYTISGFSLARAMGCGTRLCSDLFEVAGQMFRLEVYPAGFTADSRKHVSVFLTTPGSLNPNHVMFEVSVLDQSGKDKHITATSADGSNHCHHMCAPMLSCSRGVVGAVLRLAKCKSLEEKRKKYLPCDVLVIRATVHVLRSWSSVPRVHPHNLTGMHGGCLPTGCGVPYPAVMPGSGLAPVQACGQAATTSPQHQQPCVGQHAGPPAGQWPCMVPCHVASGVHCHQQAPVHCSDGHRAHPYA